MCSGRLLVRCWKLEAGSKAELAIFSLDGKLIRTLVDRKVPAGMHKAVWDAKDHHGNKMPAGIYFYRLKAGDLVQVRRMLLVK